MFSIFKILTLLLNLFSIGNKVLDNIQEAKAQKEKEEIHEKEQQDFQSVENNPAKFMSDHFS